MSTKKAELSRRTINDCEIQVSRAGSHTQIKVRLRLAGENDFVTKLETSAAIAPAVVQSFRKKVARGISFSSSAQTFLARCWTEAHFS